MRIRLFSGPILVALLVALGAVLAPGRVSSAETPAFVVIVHPQSPYRALERSFVAEAFLKKSTRWPSGDVIKPVDLPPNSRTRERFSQDVLRRSVSAVRSYWQQIIFSGRDVPPPELANDDVVVKYVETHPGAIGYVFGSTHLGATRAVVVY